MIYDGVGFALALAIAIAAWRGSRRVGGFYDREVYGLESSAHRRYAFVSVGFAAYFATAYALRADAAGVVGLGLYALIAIFYATSFLQGAHDE